MMKSKCKLPDLIGKASARAFNWWRIQSEKSERELKIYYFYWLKNELFFFW